MMNGSASIRWLKALAVCAAFAFALPAVAQDTSDTTNTQNPDTPATLPEITCNAAVPATGQTGLTVNFLGTTSSTPGGGVELNSIAGNMRYVPAGTFTQGSPLSEVCRDANEAQFTHTLTKDLAVMETEVTRQMWADLKAAQATLPNDPTDIVVGGGLVNPVQMNTWHEAVLFANLLSQWNGETRCYYEDASFTIPIDASNYISGPFYCNWDADGFRLPSEGEWEYFCRAGTTTPFWIDEPNYQIPGPCKYGFCYGPYPQLQTAAWYCVNHGGGTAAVGLNAANPWNLRDVHGNVYEWCWDRYNAAYPTGSQTDYRGPSSASYRMLRGGGFLDQADDCRSASRYAADPSWRFKNLGFRLVRSLAGTFDWNFGDGSAHSNLQSATHSYASPGTYHWVMSMSGLPCTKEGDIVISNGCTEPVITTDPASQTISIGQTAALSVAATGTGPAYRWYQGTSGDTSNLLVDGSSNAYTTPALTTTTEYWAQVYNACGQADSQTATITVAGAGGPNITGIKSKSSKPGSTVTISGSGFSTDKKKEVVYFGATKAKISKAKTKSIKVKIPKAAKGTMQVYVVVNGQESNRVDFTIK